MTNILPHEQTFLAEAITAAEVDLAQKSRQQGEEAGLGSDWHDNNAYDEAVKQTAMARGILSALKETLDQSEVVDYPVSNSAQIALGSLVLAKDKFGDMPFVIVGQRTTGASRYSELWAATNPDAEDLIVITPNSALGDAALGARLGSDLEYKTDAGKTVSISIDGLDQDWMRENFSTNPASATPDK